MAATTMTTGDGVAEWRDPQGRLHREDGQARVTDGVKVREEREPER